MRQLARPSILEIKPYVPGKPIDEIVRELGLKKDIFKIASNENPLGPSPLAMAALKKGIKSLNLYPDDSCYYLTRALAQKLNLNEEYLILGNGSVEILDLIAKAFINPNDEVIISNYSFVMFQIVTLIAGGKIIIIPLKDFRHNLEAMTKAITERTKIIFIANPNNPTGTINTAEEMAQFMEHIPENVLVVWDEAYYEYVLRKDYPDSLKYVKAGRNIIVLRTFSKIYGLAGLRLGYGIAPPELIALLRKVKMPFNVNSAAQLAGLAALEDHEHVKRSIEINAEGKSFLYKMFDNMELRYIPTEANFILIQPPMDGNSFANKLLKRGIIVRYMPSQDYSGVRITIGTKRHNMRLIKVIKEVLKNSR